jgi:ribokinase
VILDPAPAKDLDPAILKAVDIITPNESEAGLLLGWQPQTPEEGLRAAKELRARGVAAAVVKLGGKGLAVAGEGIEKILPAFKVTPIDTVAAGDSFNGGLAHALEQGQGIEMALRYAAACGALSTTKKGASAAAPTRDEVEAFLSRV